jgi:hypothetical protein
LIEHKIIENISYMLNYNTTHEIKTINNYTANELRQYRNYKDIIYPKLA